MKYASVIYEYLDGKHVLHVNIDGEKRDLTFPTEYAAMDLFKKLQTYCKLSVA